MTRYYIVGSTRHFTRHRVPTKNYSAFKGFFYFKGTISVQKKKKFPSLPFGHVNEFSSLDR